MQIDGMPCKGGITERMVVLCVCLQISAKKGDGVDELLETVLLQAEVEELMVGMSRVALFPPSALPRPSSSCACHHHASPLLFAAHACA